MHTTKLGVMLVSGEGAKKFLQGQLTCNMDDLNPGSHLLAAHCNPQGRILSLFYISQHENEFYLFMPHSLIAITINALKKYAVFFKVVLTEINEPPMFLPKNITTPNIELGIPAIYPETSGMFLPHELNLQKLNALSFNKGCYTGQEIIARMHYRGKLKSHMYRVTTNTTQTPKRGDPIYNTTRSCGTIVDFITNNDNIELLIVTSEAETHTTLYLFPNQNAELKLLTLPYSL